MSVPSKIHNIQLVKIQPEERLATTSELNLAPSLVTGCCEARRMWFEKAVKKRLTGFAQLVRYVDDFIVCFQYDSEARAFGEALRQRLAKFGLKISEEKSRIIELGRYACQRAKNQGKKGATFDFLGFTNYCDKTRSGKFKTGRKTSSKFRQKIKDMNEWLKRVRNRVDLKDWWQVLKLKLVGHYRYYDISGNTQGLRKYYYQTLGLAFKWINRRSQKRSYNWRQFYRFLAFNPLLHPKIYHLTYTLSIHRGCIPKEPDEGKPQVRFCDGAHSNLGANIPIGGGL